MKCWVGTILVAAITMSLILRSSGLRVRRSLTMRTFISPAKLDAFEQAKNSPIKMPCIILVNPYLDQNVGSVSRAMLNFGLHELRIVNPECDIHSAAARALAVGSVEVLNNAKIFSSLEECIADLDIVVATTARRRTVNQLIASPQSAAAEMITITNRDTGDIDTDTGGAGDAGDDGEAGDEGDADTVTGGAAPCKVGIMFGRERSGLNNEELALANRRVAIQTFEHFEVLNLAQAVNLMCYECWRRKLWLEGSRDVYDTYDSLGEPGNDAAASGVVESVDTGEGVGAGVGVGMGEGMGEGLGEGVKMTAAKEKLQLANSQELGVVFDRLTGGLERQAALWREKHVTVTEGFIGVTEGVTEGTGGDTGAMGDADTEDAHAKDAAKIGGSGAQDDMTEAGFSKRDMTSMQTVFRRANMNKGELRLLHGVLSRLLQ
jgi:tRNA/rRNA methyltransferase